MTPETLIQEIIRKNIQIIRELQLTNQTLFAELPRKTIQKDDGYFLNPKTGKRTKYGSKPRGKKPKLTLISSKEVA